MSFSQVLRDYGGADGKVSLFALLFISVCYFIIYYHNI